MAAARSRFWAELKTEGWEKIRQRGMVAVLLGAGVGSGWVRVLLGAQLEREGC